MTLGKEVKEYRNEVYTVVPHTQCCYNVPVTRVDPQSKSYFSQTHSGIVYRNKMFQKSHGTTKETDEPRLPRERTKLEES